MGECTLTPRFGDYGDRKPILDIGPTWPDSTEKETADPGSQINGGSGWPAIQSELKR